MSRDINVYLKVMQSMETIVLQNHSKFKGLLTMNPYWRGKISTVNLFELTNWDQLLLKLVMYFLFYKTSVLRSTSATMSLPFSKDSPGVSFCKKLLVLHAGIFLVIMLSVTFPSDNFLFILWKSLNIFGWSGNTPFYGLTYHNIRYKVKIIDMHKDLNGDKLSCHAITSGSFNI